MLSIKEKVAVLHSIRFETLKGARIGPRYLYIKTYKANIIHLLEYQFLVNHSIISILNDLHPFLVVT